MKTMILIFLLMLLIVLSYLIIGYSNNKPNLITGAVTGIASVQVAEIVSITLTVNNVDFGVVYPGTTKDTTDNTPPPFIIENTGNTKVNVTIARDSNSSSLFQGTGGGDNTDSFQFKPGIVEEDSYDTACSPSNWTNMPGTNPSIAICGLRKVENHDSAKIDLKINVPEDESIGAKSETINFIAYQS